MNLIFRPINIDLHANWELMTYELKHALSVDQCSCDERIKLNLFISPEEISELQCLVCLFFKCEGFGCVKLGE